LIVRSLHVHGNVGPKSQDLLTRIGLDSAFAPESRVVALATVIPSVHDQETKTKAIRQLGVLYSVMNPPDSYTLGRVLGGPSPAERRRMYEEYIQIAKPVLDAEGWNGLAFSCENALKVIEGKKGTE
jgi:hypothetical protein